MHQVTLWVTRLGTSAERRTKKAALTVVAKRVRAMIAAAQAIPGGGAGDVRTGTVRLRKAGRGERTLWRASQGVTVTLHEPERARELIDAGVRAGAALGEVTSISEGGGGERLPAGGQAPRDTKAESAPPTKPNKTTVTATVSVVFALQ